MNERLQVAAQLFAAIIQNTGCVKIEHSEVKGQTQFSVTGCDIPRGYDRISNIALEIGRASCRERVSSPV